ncbi:guanosine-3',5'-bis(diphosphate) 3'-pyrophosphohydrolase [Escherichia coli]|uniref:Guanosine-3',5'-bis(Diphosphate) 3'-pyrophosphohydrolase n=1 Tax=Escherichia coli TaxID=562 RepID=A0A377JXR2_ECOLX|nr:guanosine-3',5'-bis(diphosphate) 3'-pyrophosphohydrolase [Escherichia coli]
MPAWAHASTASLTRCRSRLLAVKPVEIITAPGARPNAAWLNFVVSSKAARQNSSVAEKPQRDDSVSLGRRLLNHALGGSRKLNEIPQENIQRELDRMKLATLDDSAGRNRPW